MFCLLLGWRFDYDGKCWFYEYKVIGYVQYYFFSEGDEFFDYVDVLSFVFIFVFEE